MTTYHKCLISIYLSFSDVLKVGFLIAGRKWEEGSLMGGTQQQLGFPAWRFQFLLLLSIIFILLWSSSTKLNISEELETGLIFITTHTWLFGNFIFLKIDLRRGGGQRRGKENLKQSPC